MYALRTSPKAREMLGDEIYFASKVPWIRGQLNQLQGKIDLTFWVKGTKGMGKMRFKSIRPSRTSFFKTQEWSLETVDGRLIQLLNEGDDDPFQKDVE